MCLRVRAKCKSRVNVLALSATEPNAGGAIADASMSNDGHISELAVNVADWLGWI
jgi:hypothetical protein